MSARHTIPLVLILYLTPSAIAQSSTRPPSETRVPALTASTGLIRMPTAYLQTAGSVTLFGAAVPHSGIGGAVAGVANRVEVGAAYRDIDDVDRRDFLTTFKVNLVREQLLSPAISVGILQPVGPQAEPHSAYLVVSKTIIPYFMEALNGEKRLALKLHGGYGDGLFRRSPFAGVEVAGDNGVSVIGEIIGGHGSGGVRYVHGEWSATAGLIDSRDAVGMVSYTLK